MLDQITPVILTYNEAPNIQRTLDTLRWAREIVLVDSHSDDATVTIASQFPQVRVLKRRFDRHQNQWNFALKETGITSEWVLAIDADYVLTPELVEEMKALRPPMGVNGYQARFVYCVHGKPLRGSAYSPVTVLYRRERAAYQQDGHTQRVVIDGDVRELHSPILHDDRKPLTHWLNSQNRYMCLEMEHLLEAEKVGLNFPDRLRKTRVLFPFAIFFYCLFFKGAIRDGWAGVYYAFQRMLAEILLALYLIEEDLGEARGQRSKGEIAWSKEHGAGNERRTSEVGDRNEESIGHGAGSLEQAKHQRPEFEDQRSVVGAGISERVSPKTRS
jgi:glycosyltransferase involved in cell wall biosynthesis